MSMTDIPDILKAFEEQLGDKEELFQRMEEDFDLLTLLEYKPAESGTNAYTSPSPQNYFNKIVDGLGRATTTIQIKQSAEANEESRRAATVGEQLIFGAMREMDTRLTNQGEPPLGAQLDWHICARGWQAIRVLVYTPKGSDKLVFDAVPWDIMHMAYEVGPEGLIWAAYQYNMSSRQVKSSYDIDTGAKETKITDYWTPEQNGTIVGIEWGKKLTDHDIGHVPVYVGRVGGMPNIIRKDNSSSTLKYQGESVWGASRGVYPFKNKQISWVMDRAQNAVAGSVLHPSAGGTKKLSKNPYLTYTEVQLDTDVNEDLKPLLLPEMPAEFAAIMNIVDTDEQQSTLPAPLAYGGIEGELSGRAIEDLSEATRSQFNPRTEAKARIVQWIAMEVLRQFKKKGQRKSAKFSGYDGAGEFFEVTARPSQINVDWHVQVTVAPKLPRDREQELRAFVLATSDNGTGQAMSLNTAREELIHLRDPDGERDKILIERGEGLEPIQLANIAAALKRVGQDELANQVAALGAPPEQQAQQAQQGGLTAEVVVEALVNVFQQMGGPEMAQAFIASLEQVSSPPPGPPVV